MKPHLIKVAGQWINMNLVERIVCDGDDLMVYMGGGMTMLSGDDARRFGDVVRNLAAADLDRAAEAQAARDAA